MATAPPVVCTGVSPVKQLTPSSHAANAWARPALNRNHTCTQSAPIRTASGDTPLLATAPANSIPINPQHYYERVFGYMPLHSNTTKDLKRLPKRNVLTPRLSCRVQPCFT